MSRLYGDPALVPRMDYFTGRGEEIELFNTHLAALLRGEPRHLHFHGVAGVGKSTLLERLYKELTDRKDKESGILHALHDVSEGDHSIPDILGRLRCSLVEGHGVRLHSFDFAYLLLLAKRNPGVEFNLRQYGWLTKTGALADLVLPFVMPTGSVFEKLCRAIEAGTGKRGGPYTRWWTNRGERELYFVQNTNNLNEIVDKLPRFFAEDLNDWTIQKDVVCVLFLDTHESLVRAFHTGARMAMADAWLRTLVKELGSGVMVVTAGRDPLNWNGKPDCFDQHEVKELSTDDAKESLQRRGIPGENLRNHLAAVTGGLPVWLDLCADIAGGIRRHERRVATVEDFPGGYTGDIGNRLYIRFTTYLDDDENELLKLLAVPRFFSRGLYELLLEGGRHRGLDDRFERLLSYSFVQESSAGIYRMHDALRRTILATMPGGKTTALHRRLADHYLAMAQYERSYEATSEMWINIDEAVYHCIACHGIDDLRRILKVDALINAGYGRGLMKHLGTILAAFGPECDDPYWLAQTGYVSSALGDKQQALEYYQRALPLCERVGDVGGQATTLNNIG
ncbi:ATP-binding protein, partial [bacterium]|nr:ATP-binding protein [candidate division CSSED10-310 bacterium]